MIVWNVYDEIASIVVVQRKILQIGKWICMKRHALEVRQIAFWFVFTPFRYDSFTKSRCINVFLWFPDKLRDWIYWFWPNVLTAMTPCSLLSIGRVLYTCIFFFNFWHFRHTFEILALFCYWRSVALTVITSGWRSALVSLVTTVTIVLYSSPLVTFSVGYKDKDCLKKLN